MDREPSERVPDDDRPASAPSDPRVVAEDPSPLAAPAPPQWEATPQVPASPPEPRVRVWSSIGGALGAVVRPPFLLLVLLACLVSLVSQSVPADQSEWASVALLVLLAISVYLQIATVLAAGRPEPDRSADAWVKAAFRRRCFWRFLAAGVLQIIVILVALVFGLVIGGLLVMGMIGMAQSAAALERTGPIEACRRSSDVGRRARRAVSVIYVFLLVIPGVAVQIGYAIGWSSNQSWAWALLGLFAVGLSHAGLIALTRIFVSQGGTPTPAFEAMAPEPVIQRINR